MAVNREWISVASAAGLMGVCKRQALRLLTRRNQELGGRLLRSVGTKAMPGRVQASKWLVSVSVLRESLGDGANCADRDIEALRLEVLLLGRKLASLRRAVAPILAQMQPTNET